MNKVTAKLYGFPRLGVFRMKIWKSDEIECRTFYGIAIWEFLFCAALPAPWINVVSKNHDAVSEPE